MLRGKAIFARLQTSGLPDSIPTLGLLQHPYLRVTQLDFFLKTLLFLFIVILPLTAAFKLGALFDILALFSISRVNL